MGLRPDCKGLQGYLLTIFPGKMFSTLLCNGGWKIIKNPPGREIIFRPFSRIHMYTTYIPVAEEIRIERSNMS